MYTYVHIHTYRVAYTEHTQIHFYNMVCEYMGRCRGRHSGPRKHLFFFDPEKKNMKFGVPNFKVR